MNDGDLGDAGLYRLMTWLSPSFPVGAYSYSHGLEWAIEAGDVHDLATLEDWLGTVLASGGGWNDAVLFAVVHRAVRSRDDTALATAAEWAAAFHPGAERHLESTAQGRAFIKAVGSAWPCAALGILGRVWDGAIAYPVAVAVAAAGHGIGLHPALGAYLHAFTANLVSAGVRLVPLGQSDGQRAIARLEATIGDVAGRASSASLADLGGCALTADLASLHHETQYTRLFRS